MVIYDQTTWDRKFTCAQHTTVHDTGPFLVQYKEMRPSGDRKPGGLFYSGANGPPKLQSADVSAVWCCSHAHRLASKSLETCDSRLHG